LQNFVAKLKGWLWILVHEYTFDMGYFISRTIGFVISRYYIVGGENIPRSGGVLITANHLSQWDLVMIHIVLHRRAYYMSKTEYFETPVLGGLARAWGAFGVRRGKADREALRFAIERLRAGDQVVIFPEGTRSPNFALQKAHGGAALIAAQSDALIVPLAIAGTEKRSRNPEAKWRKRPPVIVRVGQPYLLPKSIEGKRLNTDGQADFIMTKIAELLPPEYQGYYAPELMEARERENYVPKANGRKAVKV
jgi:1-acyl-sn-glycerol-3-phosphate acyltransferase